MSWFTYFSVVYQEFLFCIQIGKGADRSFDRCPPGNYAAPEPQGLLGAERMGCLVSGGSLRVWVRVVPGHFWLQGAVPSPACSAGQTTGMNHLRLLIHQATGTVALLLVFDSGHSLYR